VTTTPISASKRFFGAESGNGSGAHGPDRPCRIYLVRHGQTVMNVQVRFRGRLDVPLNEQGREEAWLVARNLAEVGLSAVYTSPLCRAREVAESISTLAHVDVREAPGLVNVDYGEWEGLTKEECARRDPEAWRRYRELPEDAICPGGEALASAADRITRALRSIGERHAGQSIAAVTHGAMVRLALLRLAPIPAEKWEVPLATGSATMFEVRAGVVSLVVSPAPSVNGHRVDGPRAAVGAPLTSAAFAQPVVVMDKTP
jgi:broad specificity phosphatase PhoE